MRQNIAMAHDHPHTHAPSHSPVAAGGAEHGPHDHSQHDHAWHNAADAGRYALKAWKASQPTNYWESDRDLRRGLERHLGAERYEAQKADFSECGAAVAALEPVVERLEYRSALPRLERYDGIGNRTEEIVYDGAYHEVGRVLYGTGVVARLSEAGQAIPTLALAYMNNELGEAGHNCPIACAMGAVKALQAEGSAFLKETFLPGLLNRQYGAHRDAAQFMTEVQGGSDVGQNSVRAMASGDPDQWAIVGEKWFCSNASANVFLMTARPETAGAGTAGLGLFLVPREAPWGGINEFKIRRLKDKLGTRVMASGEIDFEGAVGYSVGPVERGFKTMMNHVINTSRLYNASGVLGMSRRALTTGWTYAQHRVAFGSPIGRYPLVQETLAEMQSEHAVLLAGHLHLGALKDRIDLGQADDTELAFFRVALNLNKSKTCASAGAVIRSAIELLGGNGAMESFSPLPRLLRDNVVYENWEGTHNTLHMQILRDMERLGVGAGFLGDLGRRFAALEGGVSGEFAAVGGQRLRELGKALQALPEAGAALASLRMRAIADRMANLASACAMAEQAVFDHERFGDLRTVATLRYYWRRHLATSLTVADATELAFLEGLVADVGLTD